MRGVDRSWYEPLFALLAGVADIGMTMDAVEHVAAGFGGHERMDKFTVTRNASALRDPAIARLDLNRFVKVFQRECQRVKKTVVRLRHPFANRIMRQMTVVANRDMGVAGIEPCVVMVVHDMAIGAGGRIAGKVAVAFAVTERKRTNAAERTEQHRQRNVCTAET